MKHRDDGAKTVSIDHKPDPKKVQRISMILSNYGLKPVSVERVRSVYKITTEDRLYCLKRVSASGGKKVDKGAQLSRYLVSRGFGNTVKYVRTTEGKYYVKSHHSVYYLTDWIKGREVRTESIEELKKCALLLAEFHNASEGFFGEQEVMASTNGKWPYVCQKSIEDLMKFRAIIERKKLKTMFDLAYVAHMDELADRMRLSLQLLSTTGYDELSRKSLLAKSVCHDSFYYQNLIQKHNGKIYLIDLDSCIYDLCCADLAKLIRRILYKKSYAWEFNIARELIQEYEKKRTLTKQEYEVLLAMLVFPHKYWKLGRKRYVSNEKWTEEKYLRKLDKILGMRDKQNKFIAEYLNHFINEISKK